MNLGNATANKAICRGDLNKKLSSMSKEEAQEIFHALRVMKEDSPMTDTLVFNKIKGGGG